MKSLTNYSGFAWKGIRFSMVVPEFGGCPAREFPDACARLESAAPAFSVRTFRACKIIELKPQSYRAHGKPGGSAKHENVVTGA